MKNGYVTLFTAAAEVSMFIENFSCETFWEGIR